MPPAAIYATICCMLRYATRAADACHAPRVMLRDTPLFTTYVRAAIDATTRASCHAAIRYVMMAILMRGAVCHDATIAI